MTKNKTKNLLNIKGQGVMEYLIITSLVGIICLVTVQKFGKTVNKKLKKMNTHISQKIEIEND